MISLVLVRHGGVSPVTGVLGWKARIGGAVDDKTETKMFEFQVATWIGSPLRSALTKYDVILSLDVEQARQ